MEASREKEAGKKSSLEFLVRNTQPGRQPLGDAEEKKDKPSHPHKK